MMLDEFAHQASRSIRAHHASFDCVPCHCIAFVDVVGLGSNILYNFIHIIIYIYICDYKSPENLFNGSGLYGLSIMVHQAEHCKIQASFT